MSKGCLAALVFILLTLAFLYHVAVMTVVLPINVECSHNTDIPEDPAVNLSMDDWITGGLVSGCIVIGFMCLGGRQADKN